MTPSRLPQRRRQVQSLAAIAALFAYLLQFLFPTMAVTIARELHLPVGDVLNWCFVGFLLFGLGALPGGYLADRIGARRALLVGLAGTGVSALAVAEAVPGRSIVLCLGALGLFAGFHHPAAMRLLDRIDDAEHSRHQRIPHLAGLTGLGLAPIAAVVLQQIYGSRQAYSIAGFAACTLAALLGMWRAELDDDPPTRAHGRAPARLTIATRGFLMVAATLAATGFLALAISAPAYFALRGSPFNFGWIVSAVYVLAAAGWSIAETSLRTTEPRTLALRIQAISLLPLFLLGHVSGIASVTAVFVAATCGIASRAILVRLFADAAGIPRTATASAFRFAAINGVAALAIPLSAWSANDPRLLFTVVAGLTAASAGMLVLVRRTSASASTAAEALTSREPAIAVGESAS